MFKNKNVLLFVVVLLFSNFYLVGYTYASPAITSLLLNGENNSITFNPNNGESISIEVKASIPVKFTRLYICSIDQICNGTSGNYVRYFTQSDVSDTIIKSWNGKKSGDTEIVQDGEYKVMVSMVEGTSDPVVEFGQNSIFVSISTTTNQSNSTTSNNSVSTTTNTVVTRTIYVSAHSNQENISNYSENVFETSAGRERMALVGSIMEFNAKYSMKSNTNCTPVFKWIFGDGFESNVKNATYVYKYPGDYNVILNGTCGEYSSVSRTVVKITKPNVRILSTISGDIEVVNYGKEEINLGYWKIKDGQRDFVFPQDTIISSNGKVTLSSKDVLNTNSVDRVSINNPQDKEVAFYVKPHITESNHTVLSSSTHTVIEPQISIEKAEYLLAEYKKSLVRNEITREGQDVVENKVGDIATVLEAVNTPVNTGFWSKIINSPVKGIKKLINKFYDF